MNPLALERLKQCLYELDLELVPAGVLRKEDVLALVAEAERLAAQVKELESELAAEVAISEATQRTLQESHVAWARELYMQKEREA